MCWLRHISGVCDEQMNSIKHAIEQTVISRVYMYAMFPNGEVDISRDAWV